MYVWEDKRWNKLAAESGIDHLRDVEFIDWTDKQDLEFREEEDEIADDPFCSMCSESRNVFERELMGRWWC
jgi:hypothetical protein